MIDLFVQRADLDLGFQVHFVIVIRCYSVLDCLTVLAHHDDGGLYGGEAAQHEVQKNERIGIEGLDQQYDGVDDYPGEEDAEKGDDEAPASAESRRAVRYPVSEAQLLLVRRVRVDGKDIAVVYAVYHVLFQRSDLTAFITHQLRDVRLTDFLEIVSAQETGVVPFRTLGLYDLLQLIADPVSSDGAFPWNGVFANAARDGI